MTPISGAERKIGTSLLSAAAEIAKSISSRAMSDQTIHDPPARMVRAVLTTMAMRRRSVRPFGHPMHGVGHVEADDFRRVRFARRPAIPAKGFHGSASPTKNDRAPARKTLGQSLTNAGTHVIRTRRNFGSHVISNRKCGHQPWSRGPSGQRDRRAEPLVRLRLEPHGTPPQHRRDAGQRRPADTSFTVPTAKTVRIEKIGIRRRPDGRSAMSVLAARHVAD